MNNESPEKSSLTQENLVPPEWLDKSIDAVWNTGFTAMGIDPTLLPHNPMIIDIEIARIVILYGQLNYISSSDVEFISGKIPIFESKVDAKTSPEGAYVLLIQEFDVENRNESEGRVKANSEVIAGLLATYFGQNIVYHRLFDNLVYLKENKRSVFGPGLRNPLSLPIPDLTDKKITIFTRAFKSLRLLPEFEKNRVVLSLRWLYESFYSSGVDKYLKCWFALEALAMSEKENLKPLMTTLSEAYSIPDREVKRKFEIGKLYGFRNRIVHRGEIFPIHSDLSDYVEALYVDVLNQCLGLECERRAEMIRSKPGFDLATLIYT